MDRETLSSVQGCRFKGAGVKLGLILVRKVCTMANSAKWQVGNWGKGVYLADGSLHTWNTAPGRFQGNTYDEADGFPSHYDYLEGLGITPDPWTGEHPAVRTAFWLTPEGELSSLESGPDFLKAVQDAHPEASPDDRQWKFATAHEAALDSLHELKSKYRRQRDKTTSEKPQEPFSDHDPAEWLSDVPSSVEVVKVPSNHAVGQPHSGSSYPVFLNHDTQKLYVGPLNAFHWDMVHHPDLKAAFGPYQANGFPVRIDDAGPWAAGRLDKEEWEWWGGRPPEWGDHWGGPQYKFASLQPLERSPYVDELKAFLQTINPKQPTPLTPHHDTPDQMIQQPGLLARVKNRLKRQRANPESQPDSRIVAPSNKARKINLEEWEAWKDEWASGGKGYPLEFPYEPQPFRKDHHAPNIELASTLSPVLRDAKGQQDLSESRMPVNNLSHRHTERDGQLFVWDHDSLRQEPMAKISPSRSAFPTSTPPVKAHAINSREIPAWEEGKHGKGILWDDGQLQTWSLPYEFGGPHHVDLEGDDPQRFALAYLAIDPEGATNLYNGRQSGDVGDHWPQIVKQDPRLRMKQIADHWTEDWNFNQ